MNDLTTYGLPVSCDFRRRKDHCTNVGRSTGTLLSTKVLDIWMDAISAKYDGKGSFEK